MNKSSKHRKKEKVHLKSLNELSYWNKFNDSGMHPTMVATDPDETMIDIQQQQQQQQQSQQSQYKHKLAMEQYEIKCQQVQASR